MDPAEILALSKSLGLHTLTDDPKRDAALQKNIDGIRVDFGTAGEATEILTNSFRITKVPEVICQFKIEISSIPSKTIANRTIKSRKITGRKEFKAIWHALCSHAPFDKPFWAVSENNEFLWSVVDLKTDSPGVDYRTIREIHYTRPNGEPEILDYVKFTRDTIVNFKGNCEDLAGTADKPEILNDNAQILNAFFSRYASFNENLVPGGANRFFLKQSAGSMNTAMEARLGYKLSCRPGGPQNLDLLLNVNTTTGSFLKDISVPALLKAIPGDNDFYRDVFDGVQVKAAYGPQHKLRTITSFGRAASVESFKDASGKEITVQQHFSTEYAVQLRSPDGHCINVGALKDPVWIPAELLTVVPHQKCHPRLSQMPLHLAQIIKIAARPANINRDLIGTEGIAMLGLLSNDLKSFRFQVDGEMLTIPARFLKTPSVQYGKSYEARISDASWNLANVKSFFKTAKLEKLPIIVYTPKEKPAWNAQTANEFGGLLKKQLINHGLQITSKDAIAITPCSTLSDVCKMLSAACGNNWPVVVVLIPGKNVYHYDQIKTMAEVQVGINTVVCTYEKAKMLSLQYASNIAMKVNVKLGGINHQVHDRDFKDLSFPRANLMVLGADVIHPPSTPSMLGCPSVAAVVGSIDQSFATYLPSVRAQRSRQERITLMTDQVEDCLRNWLQYNPGKIINSILFLRDGVSEGQYDAIRCSEVPNVMAAWNRIAEFKGVDLKLTFVITSKRHDTRFYMHKNVSTSSKFLVKHQNVKPGCVVDTHITHPTYTDFFLQSHAALNGTARPCHYFVLRNGMQLTADALHKLTYGLCYTSPRATKGLSYPAPTYNADTACHRTFLYLEYNAFDAPLKQPTETKDEYSDRSLQRALEMTANSTWNSRRPGPWNEKLDGTMFYI